MIDDTDKPRIRAHLRTMLAKVRAKPSVRGATVRRDDAGGVMVGGGAMTREDLARPIVICCCKDRTLTWRRRKERPFNGRALPIFSVDTPEEAEALIVATCKTQHGEHPLLPGKPWRRLFLPGEGLPPKADFELADLGPASVYLRGVYATIRARPA